MAQASEQRLPVARFEVVEQEFTTANFDVVIPHTLRPTNPTDVRWEVIDRNAPGSLYRGGRAAGTDYVVLRASETGTYRIRLILESQTDPSLVALPQTEFEPAVAVDDETIVMHDSLINNVTAAEHGWVPKSDGDITHFLNAGDGGGVLPGWGVVQDSDLTLSAITANDVSVGQHGFAPALPGDGTKYLDGNGGYTVPPGVPNFFVTTKRITDAQIKSLNTAPVVIISGLGSGKVIGILGMHLFKNFVAVYSNARTWSLRYSGIATDITQGASVANTINIQSLAAALTNFAAVDGSDARNTDVVLRHSGDVTLGNASNYMEITVAYFVFDTTIV